MLCELWTAHSELNLSLCSLPSASTLFSIKHLMVVLMWYFIAPLLSGEACNRPQVSWSQQWTLLYRSEGGKDSSKPRPYLWYRTMIFLMSINGSDSENYNYFYERRLRLNFGVTQPAERICSVVWCYGSKTKCYILCPCYWAVTWWCNITKGCW